MDINLYCNIHTVCPDALVIIATCVQSTLLRVTYQLRLMSCSSALPSARQKSVFAYPKQRYGLSRICFEMTRQATMPS
jgi:hypothetical protein